MQAEHTDIESCVRDERCIIFLDIDGVLNGHDWCDGAQSNTLRRGCIQQLNRIIAATEAKIVLSSAWRYMVHCGALTLNGFEYLLRTHGTCGARIVGVTCRDEDTPGWSIEDSSFDARAEQIRLWLRDNPVTRFVVLDDDDVAGMDGVFVQTDGACGLSEKDADAAIAILLGPTATALAAANAALATKGDHDATK